MVGSHFLMTIGPWLRTSGERGKPMADGLEARVMRLERENRAMKRGALLALVVVGGVMLMGQTQGPKVSEEIRARKLCVVDEAGKPRAVLSVTGDGPELVLLDEDENARAKFTSDKVSSSLDLCDKAGFTRISLTSDDPDEDGPRLVLLDERLRLRAFLHNGKDGPGLSLLDERGHVSAALSMDKERPGLSLYADPEHTSASFSISKDGPVLGLFGQEGSRGAILSAANGGPSLNLYDPAGYSAILGGTTLVTPATGTTTNRSAASLVLFDSKKSVIWDAPR